MKLGRHDRRGDLYVVEMTLRKEKLDGKERTQEVRPARITGVEFAIKFDEIPSSRYYFWDFLWWQFLPT